MSLSAILAGLNGTGVPLGYLLLGVKSSDRVSKSTIAGATTSSLQ